MQNNLTQGKLNISLLGSLHEDEVLALDLVSAFAGDRLLTESETVLLDDLKKSRGVWFFSDLLYAITHQSFPPSTDEGLWDEVLRHKFELSDALGRNVGIAVSRRRRCWRKD